MTPEGSVVKAALEYLQMRGVYAWRNNTGMQQAEYKGKTRIIRYGFPGSSDILGVTMDGRMVCVECKFGKGKLSAYQEIFLAEMQRRGAVALVVNETNYPTVIDAALGIES